MSLYLLLPQNSDQLFNLEQNPNVTLLAAGWELKGEARIISPKAAVLQLGLLRETGAQWCVVLRVDPFQLQIRRQDG